MKNRQGLLAASIAALSVGLAGRLDAACNAAGPLNPDIRYKISEDRTEVLDTVTGLTWMRCPLGMLLSFPTHSKRTDKLPPDQQYKFDHCLGQAATPAWSSSIDSPYSSRGWRLPTRAELSTLVDGNCRNPAINPWIFPDTPVGEFWTADQTSINSHHHYFAYVVN